VLSSFSSVSTEFPAENFLFGSVGQTEISGMTSDETREGEKRRRPEQVELVDNDKVLLLSPCETLGDDSTSHGKRDTSSLELHLLMSTNSSIESSRTQGRSSEADLQGRPTSTPKSLLSLRFRAKQDPAKAFDLKEGGRASLFKIKMGIICEELSNVGGPEDLRYRLSPSRLPDFVLGGVDGFESCERVVVKSDESES